MSSFFNNTSISSIGQLDTKIRGGGSTFSKQSLKEAEFLAQVDQKFLLVRLKTSISPAGANGEGLEEKEEETTTLVMVDQHAADERVRVEKFFDQVCGKVARGQEVDEFTFGEPVPVLVSRLEAAEVLDRQEDFKRWGVSLDLPMETSSDHCELSDYAQVLVKTVPDIVSDRLRAEPKLLQELVRSYLAQLGDGPRRNGGARTQRMESISWVATIKDCPHVLLDLINSKACRGAIMFNDCKPLFSLPLENEFGTERPKKTQTSRRCSANPSSPASLILNTPFNAPMAGLPSFQSLHYQSLTRQIIHRETAEPAWPWWRPTPLGRSGLTGPRLGTPSRE